MSSGRLVVDTDFLRALGDDLGGVAREFASADSTSEWVSEQVGHPDLAGRVREFTSNWNDRREKMLGNVEQLSQSATAVGDAFAEVDAQLGAGLRGES